MFALSLLVFLSANDSNAAEACGTEFRTQMEARAFLEVNREMMVGGGVIARPDSVLEYTCFRSHATDTGDRAGSIFTSTTDWQTYNVPDPTGPDIPLSVFMGTGKLTTSINSLVLDSVSAHLGNFASRFLGGKPGAPDKTCFIMDEVFQFAKCENAMKNTHLVSFDSLINTDPRNYDGDDCTSPITQAAIDAANNPDTRDPIQVFLEYFIADNCADPIPTGLTIRRELFDVGAFASSATPSSTCQEYEDHVCATPGCYYNGSTCTQSNHSAGTASSSIPVITLPAGEQCIK